MEANHFEIVDRGEVTETVETQPYGDRHTMTIHRFERPVTVRRTLVCEACGTVFRYEVTARLQWMRSYRRDTLELDALRKLYARERRRTERGDPEDPVVCPHCGAVQGVDDDHASPVARAIHWFKRTLSA